MRFSIRTPVWTRSTRSFGSSTMVPMYHGTYIAVPPRRARFLPHWLARGLIQRLRVVVRAGDIAGQATLPPGQVQHRRVGGILQLRLGSAPVSNFPRQKVSQSLFALRILERPKFVNCEVVQAFVGQAGLI